MGVGVHQHIRTGVSCGPLHCQQKGIVQKLVDLMEGGARKGALLLLGREVSPLAHGLDQRNDERIPYGEIAHCLGG